MKKVIYFFALALILASCNITKAVYDDVYDQAESQSFVKADDDKGYADYIKKEEKRYKVKPEKSFYSSGFANNTNNQYSNNGNYSYNSQADADYYCYYHRYFHTHRFDTYFCTEWPTNNPYQYQNNYGFNSNNIYAGSCNYSINNTYGFGNNNYFNSQCYGYNFYPNNPGYYYNNGGNYYNSPWYNGNNNNTNTGQGDVASNTGNYIYGHRNGRSVGRTSGNTTAYPNTVKKLDNSPKYNGVVYQNNQNIAVGNQVNVYKPQPQVIPNPVNKPILNSGTPVKVDNQNANVKPILKAKPAVNQFAVADKKGNSNSGSGSNGNSGYNYNPNKPSKYNSYANSNSGSSSNGGSSSASSRRNSSSYNRGSNSGSSYTPRANNSSSNRGGGSSSSGSSSSGSSSKSTGGSSRR